MTMTVKELREYLDTVEDQDMNVYFYQYDQNKNTLLGVEEEEISFEMVHKSPFDGKLRIVPMSKLDEEQSAKKALIFT